MPPRKQAASLPPPSPLPLLTVYSSPSPNATSSTLAHQGTAVLLLPRLLLLLLLLWSLLPPSLLQRLSLPPPPPSPLSPLLLLPPLLLLLPLTSLILSLTTSSTHTDPHQSLPPSAKVKEGEERDVPEFRDLGREEVERRRREGVRRRREEEGE